MTLAEKIVRRFLAVPEAPMYTGLVDDVQALIDEERPVLDASSPQRELERQLAEARRNGDQIEALLYDHAVREKGGEDHPSPYDLPAVRRNSPSRKGKQ